MAVDTENKRRSAIGLPIPTAMPEPDGTIDDNDRMHVIGIYSGIDPGAAAVPVNRKKGLLLGVY